MRKWKIYFDLNEKKQHSEVLFKKPNRSIPRLLQLVALSHSSEGISNIINKTAAFFFDNLKDVRYMFILLYCDADIS